MRGALLALLLFALLLFAGAARADPVEIPGPDGITLKAQLFRPAGPATAPAIVALHGCGGAFAARDAQWRAALLAAGHILLFPDSFGSRGLGPQCRERHRVAAATGLRRQDAIAAAQWLTAQPGVAPGLVLLGWSNGASTTLATARTAPDLPPGLFRGFVAFYPGCALMHAPGYTPAAPLLMLHGEADDWTPIAPCRAAMAQIASPLITQQAYPGAYHDFDAPVPVRLMHNIPGSQNADHTIHHGENPTARADALARVPAFIDGLK
jgi:dienelactone hydrolase